MEEVYEGTGGSSMDPAQIVEILFSQLQKSLYSLVQRYEIKEDDLKSFLEDIGKLWELVEETQDTYETYKDKLNELEQQWSEEKAKIRAVEKRKADIENRLDEERYHWQNERQELNKEIASLQTKNKHLTQRNKELVADMNKQKEQFDENQKMRDELMEQYKKQYEIARTSSLRRSKKSKTSSLNPSTAAPIEYNSSRRLPKVSPSHSLYYDDSGKHSMSPPIEEVTTTTNEGVSPRQKRRLPQKNTVSLKTEINHSTNHKEESSIEGDENSLYEREDVPVDEEAIFSYTLQQELLNVSSDILAPAAAELQLLKKELDEIRIDKNDLQDRYNRLREDKEEQDRNNAEMTSEVNQYQLILQELQQELDLIRAERDEILETYLDQPFDVYCVTKKELHEVLKKLHETQLEVHQQSEEKQYLKMQLEKRKNKKSGWRKFADRFRKVFHKQNHHMKLPEENPLVEEAVTSFQVPPEAQYSPKAPEDIIGLENFCPCKGWLIPKDGLLSSDTLPSLYCQITLKEYHVTERINCVALGQVYHTTHTTSNKRKHLLPLAARTPKGRLSAEVWVASSEGPASFIEIIDVLAKKVSDRFLIRGTKVINMLAVPGLVISTCSTPSSLHQNSTKFLTEGQDYHQTWFSSPLQTLKEGTAKVDVINKEKETFIEEEAKIIASSSPQKLSDLSEDSTSNSPQGFRRRGSAPMKSLLSSDTSPNSGGIEVYSDDETDFRQNNNSFNDEIRSVTDKCMWVLSDDERLYIYSLTEQHNRCLKSIKLPSKPSSINYYDGKVVIGLVDSKLIIYHNESTLNLNSWDFEKPTLVDLPILNPEKLQPVYSIAVVNKRLWVATGSFISLLDSETFVREGMRFLESIHNVINKLHFVNEVVIATTLKGSQLYVLDSVRAEVIQKVDLSPTSLLLDNLMSFTTLDITRIIDDTVNIYIGTSIGKVFVAPLSFFSKQNLQSSKENLVYPPPISTPFQSKLFTSSGVTLHAYREGPVQGLLHIKLPKTISAPLSASALNLALSASSIPSLFDSPPLSRANKTYPLYNSLLVSGGRGHVDYLDRQDIFEESTAARERNDAFQLMVWGYDDSQH